MADDKKKASIDLDEISEKKLNEISASQFLAALNAGGSSIQQLTHWPEKKKVELWREPENFEKIPVGDILTRIRAEKKKYELEKFPGFENWRDPRDMYYDDILDRLARDIEERIRVRR